MSRWILGFLMALSLIGLTGCNTMEGAGEDVEAAGEAIQDKADSDE